MIRKYLRIAIAAFVVIFAAIVVLSLERGRRPPAPAPLPKGDPAAVVRTTGKSTYERFEMKILKVRITSGSQATYADNRSVFGDHVHMELPDRNNRTFNVDAQTAEVTTPPGHAIGRATVTGDVTLTTSDGVTIKSANAIYDDTTGIAQIPGPLTFQKGRMEGSGIGGSYDRNRELLTILSQATMDAAPDEKGAGAMHVTAASGLMDRLTHYMKFTGSAKLDGEGRITSADEATAYLTPDNDKVTRMELRGNSAILAKPGQSGPQAMRARDIDMTYAPDGRTLQTAHLVEGASLTLPGDPGKPVKRISGSTMDIALAPDGTTVTNLTANEKVGVQLPPDGDLPAREIHAQTLIATGTPAAGIQAGAFTGGVTYRETRAAHGPVEAINRTARSLRMDVKTKPGFGDIEEADFHTNVHFTNGTDTTADAPTANYIIAADRLDLSVDAPDAGRGPHVSDGRVTVDALHIHMTLGAQTMKADTKVRGLMQQTQPQKPGTAAASAGAGGGASTSPPEAVHVPGIMKQDQPVNVQSNRLDYDGAKSVAVYSGNARLWQETQDSTVIQADTIALEDKTGNLHATTNVITDMTLTEATDAAPPAPKDGSPSSAPKDASTQTAPATQTAAKKPQSPPAKPEPTITHANDLLYVDNTHQATYTGSVHMNGPNGDVTADRMDLFFTEDGSQLQRAEAYATACTDETPTTCVISKQQGHRAYGSHLTYQATDGLYTMVGNPVKMYDDTPPNCKLTRGATLTFDREGNRSTAVGNGTSRQQTVSNPCGSGS